MEHDLRYQRFSPGILLLCESLEGYQTRGVGLIDLGGEGDHWKERWANDSELSYSLSWPLGGTSGWLWRQKHRLWVGRPSSTEGTIDLQPLRTKVDWAAARPALETFAATLHTDPWENVDHAQQLHDLFWPDATVWWLRLRATSGRDVGMMLLGQEDGSGPWGRMRVLRSLDAMLLETSSLWSSAQDLVTASSVLSAHLPAIAKATGADLVRLYRQSPVPARALAEALRSARCPHESRIFTTAKRIVLPEDFADYVRFVGSKRVRDIRRRARKLAIDTGSEPRFWMRAGDLFAQPGFESVWLAFEHLRAQSWQMSETAASGKADPRDVAAYTRAMAQAWSRAGALEIAGLELGGQLVAAHLNVRGDGRTWMVLMNHDPRWRSHGVGMQLLLRMLETAHSQGDRVFELGGEATSWKDSWTNAEAPVQQLTVALPSVFGRVWGLGKTWGRTLRRLEPSSHGC